VNAPFTPPLAARFNQPAGWQWKERLETREGQYVRMGWVLPPDAKALVVILPGLSEYVEKYFETAHDLLARGFAVAGMDWRSQGRSWRHAPDRREHDSFDTDLLDAAAFVGEIPAPAAMPRILLGHSMGGHLGLRLMHSASDAFCCAVLSAPMFGINFPFAERVVRGLTVGATRVGMGSAFLPGSGLWTDEYFETNIARLTSDEARIDMQRQWMKDEALRMGGLTYNWLAAAFRSMDVLADPAYLRAITTPSLLVEAGEDHVVLNAAIEAAAKTLPRAEHLLIPGARHELLMERDVYRNQFWRGFDAFIAKYL
jgi:lysophospholipase